MSAPTCVVCGAPRDRRNKAYCSYACCWAAWRGLAAERRQSRPGPSPAEIEAEATAALAKLNAHLRAAEEQTGTSTRREPARKPRRPLRRRAGRKRSPHDPPPGYPHDALAWAVHLEAVERQRRAREQRDRRARAFALWRRVHPDRMEPPGAVDLNEYRQAEGGVTPC